MSLLLLLHPVASIPGCLVWSGNSLVTLFATVKTMNQYQQGNAILISVKLLHPVTFTPFAPASVLLRVLPPNGGMEQDFSGDQLNNPSTGQYNCAVNCNTPGVWTYRWEATGNCYAASENQFQIIASVFTSPE
jgi:hypothetical protein